MLENRKCWGVSLIPIVIWPFGTVPKNLEKRQWINQYDKRTLKIKNRFLQKRKLKSWVSLCSVYCEVCGLTHRNRKVIGKQRVLLLMYLNSNKYLVLRVSLYISFQQAPKYVVLCVFYLFSLRKLHKLEVWKVL